MRKFRYEEEAVYLWLELARRIVADEYDSVMSYVESASEEYLADYLQEGTNEWQDWFDDEVEKLYYIFTEQVNRYVENGGIDSPKL